jgi:membrane associated rhomboid family serine protease
VIPFLPGSNIAWQAHIGGLAAGALIGAAWDRLPLTRGSAGKRTAVALAVGAAAFLVVLLV